MSTLRSKQKFPCAPRTDRLKDERTIRAQEEMDVSVEARYQEVKVVDMRRLWYQPDVDEGQNAYRSEGSRWRLLFHVADASGLV
jgi:hypothetical protein